MSFNMRHEDYQASGIYPAEVFLLNGRPVDFDGEEGCLTGLVDGSVVGGTEFDFGGDLDDVELAGGQSADETSDGDLSGAQGHEPGQAPSSSMSLEEAEDQILSEPMVATTGLGLELRGDFDGSVIFALDPDGTEQVGFMPLEFQSSVWRLETTEMNEVYGKASLYLIFKGEGQLELRHIAFL